MAAAPLHASFPFSRAYAAGHSACAGLYRLEDESNTIARGAPCRADGHTGRVVRTWANRKEEDCRRTTRKKTERTAPCDGQQLWFTTVALCDFPAPVAAGAGVLSIGPHVSAWTPTGDAARLQVCTHRVGLGRAWVERWMQHYEALGAERFLLYDDTTTPWPTLLRRRRATVVFTSLASHARVPSWYHQQVLATHDCFARARAEGATWTLYADVDEFLIAPTDFVSFFRASAIKAVSFPVRTLRGSSDSCVFAQQSSGDNARCEVYTRFGNRKYMMSPLGAPESIHRMHRGECRLRGDGAPVYMLHAGYAGSANSSAQKPPSCVASARRAAPSCPRLAVCLRTRCLNLAALSRCESRPYFSRSL